MMPPQDFARWAKSLRGNYYYNYYHHHHHHYYYKNK